MSLPLLVFTQGDPAGIGPEVVVRALLGGAGGGEADPNPSTEGRVGSAAPAASAAGAAGSARLEPRGRADVAGGTPLGGGRAGRVPATTAGEKAADERQEASAAPGAEAVALPASSAAPPRAGVDFLPLLIAEAAALEALRPSLPDLPWDRLEIVSSPPSRQRFAEASVAGRLPVLDPVGGRRRVDLGNSAPADAAGALAALDAGRDLVASGAADALVTAPLSKESIARHLRPGFVGHTEYLAAAAGLERYGRDYLMAFLATDLQVALLSTHLPLRAALDAVSPEAIGEALDRLAASAGGRLAVAGLNPHAGEGGLLGSEDAELVAPAVAAARARGLDVHGPEPPDSVFARARRGDFDWVLALYHDQGLIAVKTAAFGTATNWTLGLPYLRTSVDHGTAFALAGRAAADPGPTRAVMAATLDLLAGRLPRRRIEEAAATTPRGRSAPPGSS